MMMMMLGLLVLADVSDAEDGNGRVDDDDAENETGDKFVVWKIMTLPGVDVASASSTSKGHRCDFHILRRKAFTEPGF